MKIRPRSKCTPRACRRALRVLTVLVLALLGCEDPTEPPPVMPPTNTDQPNANALVTAHRIVGDPTKGTSFYDLMDMEDGTFLVSGILDGRRFLSRLQNDGTPMWDPLFTDYAISETHVLTLPGGGRAVAVVGQLDANSDGTNDRSVVAVYDVAGDLLHRLDLGAMGADIVLADVEVLAETAERCQLLVAGYTSADLASLPFRPLAGRIDVLGDGSFELGTLQTYPDLTWFSFRDAESDAVTSPATFVSGNVHAADGAAIRAFVGRLSASLELEWVKGFVVVDDHRSFVRTGSLQVEGGVLYVVGESDVDKADPPANGGHWMAGLAAAYAPSGQLRWSQIVGLTGHGEALVECRVDGPHLYAAGKCASYQLNDSGENFGYALLAKFDRANGTVLATMSFGDPHYSSGFNSLVVQGNRAVCVGWTNNWYANDGCFQGWFTDIAVGGPASPRQETSAGPTPALAAIATTSAGVGLQARPEADTRR